VTVAGGVGTEELRRRERLYRVLSRTSLWSRPDERLLLVIGAALVTGGLAAVVVGYLGASGTVLVAGQIPYLISGGLLGVALVFLGGFAYFGYWLAVMVREGRADRTAARSEREELRLVLTELTRSLQEYNAPSGRSRTSTRER
jgi:hypothetical protein